MCAQEKMSAGIHIAREYTYEPWQGFGLGGAEEGRGGGGAALTTEKILGTRWSGLWSS